MKKNKSNQETLFCDRFKVLDTYTGGMATVSVCQDVHNRRIVAAKAPHFAPELFSREARMWLGLGEHPNIVKAHLVHNIDNVPYLFMNFIGDENDKSQTFRQALMRTPNRYNLILNTGIGVVNALEYARSIYPGFVHRDIKPENILIDKSEHVILSDFGIGHIPRLGLIDNNDREKLQNVTGLTFFTQTGGFIGTLGYASPEQYLDSSVINFKSDIYSLGVVLFEALYHILPYDPKLIAEDGYKCLQEPLKIRDDFSNEIEMVMDKLVLKMLNPSAKFRHRSLSALKHELKKIKRDSGFPENKNKKPTYPKRNNDAEATYVNRIYSFIELGEHELAISNITKFQKQFPFSQRVKTIVHRLFQRMPDDLCWKFIKNVTINSISNSKWAVAAVIMILFTTGPFIGLQITSGLPMPFALLSIFLLVVLQIEKYINSRTSITLDRITLNGMVTGFFLSFILSLFHLQTIAGGIGKSLAGLLIGLIIPLSFSWIYQIKSGKEGVGGGTIKLSAMIGSWTGLLIIPIIIVAVLIIILQALVIALIRARSGYLKWNQDILSPSWILNALPTSTAMFYSTWLLLLYVGMKLLKHDFLSNIDKLMVWFLP